MSKPGPVATGVSAAPPSSSHFTDKDNLRLEVVFAQPSVPPGTAPSQSSAGFSVECPVKAAQVSPILGQAITKLRMNDSTKPTDPVKVIGRSDNGKMVLQITGLSVCSKETVARVVHWMDYHTLDEQFEKNCRFAQFNQDEYEQELQRLLEKPCYFDWHFITNLGGGESCLSANKQTDFYQVVVLADQLGLVPLVLLAGKYMCKSIRGKSVQQVRNILGLGNRLSKQEEARIKQANDAIFSDQPVRRRF